MQGEPCVSNHRILSPHRGRRPDRWTSQSLLRDRRAIKFSNRYSLGFKQLGSGATESFAGCISRIQGCWEPCPTPPGSGEGHSGAAELHALPQRSTERPQLPLWPWVEAAQGWKQAHTACPATDLWGPCIFTSGGPWAAERPGGSCPVSEETRDSFPEVFAGVGVLHPEPGL